MEALVQTVKTVFLELLDPTGPPAFLGQQAERARMEIKGCLDSQAQVVWTVDREAPAYLELWVRILLSRVPPDNRVQL